MMLSVEDMADQLGVEALRYGCRFVAWWALFGHFHAKFQWQAQEIYLDDGAVHPDKTVLLSLPL